MSESQEALAVIRRETQSPTYWHNFQVSESDLEQITTLFILTEQPHSVEDLALNIIQHPYQAGAG
jgi:hypothetical protein